MRKVFSGARLFDGERMIEDSALVVEDGAIVAVTPFAARPLDAESCDLRGGVLAPGLIDWQVNGGGGVLFNETPTVAGIRAIVEAHRGDGTTSLLPTLITDAPDKLEAALAAAAEAHRSVPGALGIHVEGPFIDIRRKGAHPLAFIRAMTRQDADRLIAAKAGIMVVTLAPAAVSNDLIARLAQNGIIVSIGHSEATAEEAQAAFKAGASAVTHLYNAMSQLGHRQPGLVGAALADRGIVCGFIADGHHVHEAAARAAFNAKGVDGLALISDAMPPAAGGAKAFYLEGRRVTQVGTKLTLDDGTLAGAAITLMDAVRYATQTLGIELTDALRMATLTPARLLRVDDNIGRFKPGYRADLVHLADDLSVRGVWIGGEASARDS
ncbi:N-acetylglucosamine-6-phosphate deacetylase [Methylocapsa sp. S129]|uniref:N-acetylglucosamine-6-phosphate deacetylase n=1 Tax=Methylocapsa sp. S129 TaxID=1641869 RepID=UPI00131E5CD3|nr:N-acetylglucosamine-6-phosphate deacetylase [Methylocapsa sp. S129]